jgi:hypothetical protein
MRVKRCIRTLSFFLMLFIISCGTKWVINSENPQNLNLNNYKNIYVDWIDLEQSRWKEFEYQNQAAWVERIKDTNAGWFRQQMQKNFEGRQLSFADVKNSKPVGDLHIHIYNTHVDRKWSAWENLDYIDTDLSFIDLNSGKEIYKASIRVSSKRFGPHAYSFEGRMGFAVSNLADYIAIKFNLQPVN